MPSFRQVPNGFVHDALSDGDLVVIFKNLALLRKDSYNDFEMVVRGYVTIETLRDASRLIGPSFRQFMEANYDGGRGPLAGLVKDIAHYLNGRIGDKGLISSIRVEERKLLASARLRSATYTPTRGSGSSMPLLEDGYVVHDYDFYRLMGGISPANVGRIMLLLGGDSYYV